MHMFCISLQHQLWTFHSSSLNGPVCCSCSNSSTCSHTLVLKRTSRWNGRKPAIQRTEMANVALIQTRVDLLKLHVAAKIVKLYVNTATPYCDTGAVNSVWLLNQDADL